MEKELELLKKIENEITLLEAAAGLAYWDKATIMPKKGIKDRARLVAYLNTQLHEKNTSKELNKCIKDLAQKKQFLKLSNLDQLIVRKYQKRLKRLNALPIKHVEEFSKLAAESFHAWETAKETNNFSLFEPFLEKLITLKKKEANYIDPNKNPYDVLLDDFEEGMTSEQLDEVFPRLKQGVLEILNKIKETKQYKTQKSTLKKLTFEFEQQKIIVQDLKEKLGVTKDVSFQAESTHPFMLRVGPQDVRITTNYREHQPFFSFSSTAHECGHALYELGFGKELRNTILFDAPSYGLHESQSRVWENEVTRSKEFWKYYYPYYKKQFSKALKGMSLDEFYKQINQVKPSLIRIESDELTYVIHIIIRYELERALLEGNLLVKDLPDAWSEKYKDYLGVEPKTDSEGVLQDMHWSEGLFGYFPTYAIGTMYAAMLFAQLRKDKPKIDEVLAKGNLKTILLWLRSNVHKHGGRKLSDELIKEVCGKGLSEIDFLTYLKEKYYDLYGVEE
tara:strand:- start:123 stop:1640 length:1518 start_codon:yes stop_codon:yes gene_type:complete